MNGRQSKILYIITKSVWGGAGRYVYDLATGLPRDSFDVAVTLGGQEILVQKLRERDIAIYPIPAFQKSINLFKDIRAFFQLYTVIKAFGPDIVHTNSSKAGGIASVAVKLYNIRYARSVKTIFTVHGWAFFDPVPQWQIFLRRMASRLTAKLHDSLICISTRDRNEALELNVPESKIVTIYNGVDHIDFLSRKEAQEKLLGREHNFVVGTVAEYTKNKGLEFLIQAWPNILKEFPDAKLCLVGWGEETKNYELRITNFGLQNSVFLVRKSPVARYLTAFDIFVLPSLKEGLPYTLMEAGLAELPIVASNVGGVPDIIEHNKNGVLVSPASAGELTSEIISLARDPQKRNALGISARKTIQENFTLERMVRETMRLYAS